MNYDYKTPVMRPTVYFKKEEQVYCYKRLKAERYFRAIEPLLKPNKIDEINRRVEDFVKDLQNKIASKKNTRLDNLWKMYEDSVFLMAFQETNSQRIYFHLTQALEKRYLGRLMRQVREKVKGNYVEVEDLPSRVFNQLIVKLQQGSLTLRVSGAGVPTIEKYVFGILRKQIFNFYSKQKKRLNTKVVELEQALGKIDNDTGVSAVVERERRIKAALSILTKEERELIILHKIEKKSYDEIVRYSKDKNANAVKQRLYRIMIKLKRFWNTDKK